jgi:hypothetical protein
MRVHPITKRRYAAVKEVVNDHGEKTRAGNKPPSAPTLPGDCRAGKCLRRAGRTTAAAVVLALGPCDGGAPVVEGPGTRRLRPPARPG